MDMKIELVSIPVTDVDRAKAFYVDQVGFNADHDQQVNPELRFVQLTPPGSACSIYLGTGLTEMAPGSQKGLQMVVKDVVRRARGAVEPRRRDRRGRRAVVGIVHLFRRSRRQHLVGAAAARRGTNSPRPSRQAERTSFAAGTGRSGGRASIAGAAERAASS